MFTLYIYVYNIYYIYIHRYNICIILQYYVYRHVDICIGWVHNGISMRICMYTYIYIGIDT